MNVPVKPARRLLVLGGGYTGLRFGRALASQAAAVTLTRRALPQLAGKREGLRWLHFDSRERTGLNAAAIAGTTHLLVTAPPDGSDGDGVLRSLAPLLNDLPLEWVGYLSTTGVYGDSGGAWVDEQSSTEAARGRSRARLEAEQAWLASGLPVQSFRLPAIYGPGRSPFAALRRSDSRLIHKPGQVFSRVHVDDIVGALHHCLNLPAKQRPTVLNVVDNVPCPSSETLGYAAWLLDLKLPALEPYDAIAAGLSTMARSFWQENRRASNRLLTQGLGYRLRYPSYREGYRACLAEETAAETAAAAGRHSC
ncbi:MAG: SDR family NAD(P)-dependent oxidoreductase [Cyanobacteriota bacterium]|nr:SDR family NAD(P)-dependent oxidoreductase [Cyanobacteriota bacterium]